ncbi:hypothetical protein [Streptomyces sp. GD-15H]|uniref:hypothetical protein n=1 Tax=Streptomyces sp. GD-15H TaxID=3129112 RepID=UPI0038739A3A
MITGFTVQVDHAKLGWGIEAFVELSCAGSIPAGEIVRTVYKAPEVQPGQEVILLIPDVLPYQSEGPPRLLLTLRIAGTQAFDVGDKIVDLLMFLLDPGGSSCPSSTERRTAGHSTVSSAKAWLKTSWTVSCKTRSRSPPSSRA